MQIRFSFSIDSFPKKSVTKTLPANTMSQLSLETTAIAPTTSTSSVQQRPNSNNDRRATISSVPLSKSPIIHFPTVQTNPIIIRSISSTNAPTTVSCVNNIVETQPGESVRFFEERERTTISDKARRKMNPTVSARRWTFFSS